MKHAGPSALVAIKEMLAVLRKCPGLKERNKGVFYIKSAAFLHFHEDPAGLFADLKEAGEWRRYPVNTRQQKSLLIKRVKIAANA